MIAENYTQILKSGKPVGNGYCGDSN